MTQKPRSSAASGKGATRAAKAVDPKTKPAAPPGPPVPKAKASGRRQAGGGTSTKKGDASGAAGQAKPETKSRASGPGRAPVVGLFDRADQIGTILGKGLDLVEAGVALGLNLVNRLGAIAQESIINRLATPFSAAAGSAAQPKTEAAGEASEASQAATAAPDQGGESYIANRIPGFAGHPTRVTFSINNDAYDTPKHVRLSVEGFTGRNGGATFDATHLVIEPAIGTIEPMDFEKFTLSGTLPRDLRPDVYEGRILVASDETIGIPVRLLVSEPMER